MSGKGMDVCFAGCAVRINWDGETTESLVRFLFGGTRNLDTDQPTIQAQPQIQFTIGCPDQDGMLTVNGSNGETMRGGLQETALFLIERVTYHIADNSRAGALLHAACLAKNGEALVLPGVSGAGKSTLAFWLEQQGYQFLTDELVFIPQGTLQCQGLARPINLKGVSDEMLCDLSPERIFPENRGDNQPAYRKFVRSQTVVSDAQLKGFVFPRYKKRTSFVFHRLSGAETALALTGSLVNARNLPDNGFPELLRLARSVAGYRMEYGNFDEVASALDGGFQKV